MEKVLEDVVDGEGGVVHLEDGDEDGGLREGSKCLFYVHLFRREGFGYVNTGELEKGEGSRYEKGLRLIDLILHRNLRYKL